MLGRRDHLVVMLDRWLDRIVLDCTLELMRSRMLSRHNLDLDVLVEDSHCSYAAVEHLGEAQSRCSLGSRDC